MKPKLTLEQWAQRQFEKPPCAETLWRWRKGCKIFPMPEKIGRAYYVDPDARYIDPADPKSYGT